MLVPVTGQLTRWINGDNERLIHQRPGGDQTGLMGGGNGGSKGGGGHEGSAGAPTGHSMAAIRAYDRSHSQPSVSGGHADNGGFSHLREVNDRQRQEALDRATSKYLSNVGKGTAVGAARGMMKGSPGGVPGSAGAGIVEGVAGMGISAVVGGIELAKEREKIEREQKETAEAIDRAEIAEHDRKGPRDGSPGGIK